jgi:hypothetical protein
METYRNMSEPVLTGMNVNLENLATAALIAVWDWFPGSEGRNLFFHQNLGVVFRQARWVKIRCKYYPLPLCEIDKKTLPKVLKA